MKKDATFRINIFFVFVVLLFGLIMYRLFVLAYLEHALYSKTAEAQNENIQNVMIRGNIYIKDPVMGAGQSQNDLFLAATNKKFPLAYVVPADIGAGKTGEAINRLSQILGLERDGVAKTINSGTANFRILARKITALQVDEIKNLGIKGVGITYETDRFYPGDKMAANVIGFFGYSGERKSGQYGVEAYYDSTLHGKTLQAADYLNPREIVNGVVNAAQYVKTFLFGEKGGEKKEIVSESDASNFVDRPADIILTIDKNIQTLIEEKLAGVMKKWEAAEGTIIVQNPITGAILAMADRPTFSPNNYKDFGAATFLNSSTQKIFEPGSSFKPVTMSAGLDTGKVKLDTTFTDTGAVEIGDYTIRNFNEKLFGTQTMSQVLEKSINTGAIFVEGLVGDENFRDYVINMGFGQQTGIDLPGELNGDIGNLYSGRKINFMTAAFGQGIAVTPIQLINAYSAIANGGKLMKPYIVEKIIREGGEESAKTEIMSMPISEKTSLKLKTMLVSVVDNGFDKARIKGYDVAGKTGTAQIPDGRGGYSQDEFIHNFVGFAPAFDPKFVILIKMDKPKGIKFAADSLSPVFREIADYIIKYYKIPPTR